MRDLVEAAGAHLVRDHRVNRHHDAHHGDQHDRPDRGAERDRGQFGGADVARHRDVRHAHADGGQLADQHRPGQAPQGGDFGADGGRGLAGGNGGRHELGLQEKP
jgi:hypothetical protein